MYKLVLPLGYAYTLVAFYLFYMTQKAAVAACISTVLFPSVLAVGVFIKRLYRTKSILEEGQISDFPIEKQLRNELFYPLMIALTVCFLAGWPYFLKGFGNYWHSGNYDMEDGLNGRDAYLNNLVLDSNTLDLGIAIKDAVWANFAKVTGTRAKRAHQADSYRSWYAGDGFRFQYSSLAFWSVVLNTRHGLDAFLIQALVNLIMMAVGIYYLSRISFGLKPSTSAIAALASIASSFYLTTYFAGHEGSMIYGSLIPALLILLMPKPAGLISAKNRILLAGLLIGAIIFTYPHPLVCIFIPLLGFYLASSDALRKKFSALYKNARKNPIYSCVLWIIFLFVVIVTITTLWQFTENYRLRQINQYRAWGFTRCWLILPLFLGVISSPIEGKKFVGTELSDLTYLTLNFVSSLVLILMIACFFKARFSQNKNFPPLFGIFWIVGCFFFYTLIADSYYIYKYLYVHQFIFIIGIAAYVSECRSFWIKAVCLLLALANLRSDVVLAKSVSGLSFNQNPEHFKEVLKLNPDVLKESFVEIAGGDGIAVRQTLKASGFDTVFDARNAKHFIFLKGQESDITGNRLSEIVASTTRFLIGRAPENNFLMIRTWFEPEYDSKDPFFASSPFRWLAHRKNDNLGIYVIRPQRVEDMQGKFLRMCFQRGPSSLGAIPVKISAAGKELLAEKELTGSGVYCVWIPAEHVLRDKCQPLVVRSGATGKSLLPRDDRILLYRVFSIGWTNMRYDEKSLAFFNLPDDIVGKDLQLGKTGSAVQLKLGQGWETLENHEGARFRWVSGSAEFVLAGLEGNGTAEVSIDLEPGPSLGPNPLILDVLDEEGKKLMTSRPILGREKLIVSLPYRKQKVTPYTLRTTSSNFPVPRDTRILNYRVFGLEINPKMEKTL